MTSETPIDNLIDKPVRYDNKTSLMYSAGGKIILGLLYPASAGTREFEVIDQRGEYIATAINEHDRLTQENQALKAEVERLAEAISLRECVECAVASFEISPVNPSHGFCWNCQTFLAITKGENNE